MKYIIRLILVACILFAKEEAQAQEKTKSRPDITFGIDFCSAYVFHGMTYNDGAVLQPLLSIAGKSFVYTMWSNFNLVDDDNGLGHFDANEVTECDHFFTYLIPVKFVDLDATLGIYTYPALSWECDKEIQVGASKTINPLLIAFARGGYMIDGSMTKNIYVEFGTKGSTSITKKLNFDYQLKASWEKQGFVDGNPSGLKDFLGTVGLTMMTGEASGFTAKANYVGQLDDEILTDELYDVSFYASVGFFINF